MEIPNPEKPKPKIYLPEVRAIIQADNFLIKSQKDLAGKGDKKETLFHSQRMTNLGYLLAKRQNFSDEEIKYFVETCLEHDIGKIGLPLKFITKPFGKFDIIKDLRVVQRHAVMGYRYLKHEGRSPRVCNPILVHHEFQELPYPDTNAYMLKLMEEMEDVDVDNGRLLAMVDVFDTLRFGRPSVKIVPLVPEQAEKTLLKQFSQSGDEEIISFLMSQYEKIKDLSGS